MFSLLPKEPDGSISPKATKVVFAVLGLGIAALLAPIIAWAVKGIVGLIVALLVGFTALKAAPWVSMTITNFFLKAIRWEARRNPIETKMAIYAQRTKEADAIEAELKVFNGDVQLYHGQVQKLKADYPEDAPRFEAHYQAMADQLAEMYAALNEARAELVKYKKGIDRASAIWDMANSSNKLTAAANRLSKRDAIQQIQADEALNAVEAAMAQSFSNLDHLRRTKLKPSEAKPVHVQPQAQLSATDPIILTQVGGTYVAEPVQQRRTS